MALSFSIGRMLFHLIFKFRTQPGAGTRWIRWKESRSTMLGAVHESFGWEWIMGRSVRYLLYRWACVPRFAVFQSRLLKAFPLPVRMSSGKIYGHGSSHCLSAEKNGHYSHVDTSAVHEQYPSAELHDTLWNIALPGLFINAGRVMSWPSHIHSFSRSILRCWSCGRFCSI